MKESLCLSNDTRLERKPGLENQLGKPFASDVKAVACQLATRESWGFY